MNKLKFQFGVIIILFILLLSGMTVRGVDKKKIFANNEAEEGVFDNYFYFVHITDTHVMNQIFDRYEVSKKRFQSVLDCVCSFEKKPAFIVITGDLTEWGGNRVSGALNCHAFASCFYEKNGQFYADEDYFIPVYTTPGNHDYSYNRDLLNYHRFIENETRYIVNYSDVSLFFMSSGPNYFGELYNWVNNIDGDGLYDCDLDWLEGALENCSSSMKIVLMHHPAVNVRDENNRMWAVIARNRDAFVMLCEKYNVELVLTGHTHEERIFDGNETFYSVNTSLNCSLYPTLFVQTDDCKQGVHYRNVSVIGTDVWIDSCVEVNLSVVKDDFHMNFQQFYAEVKSA